MPGIVVDPAKLIYWPIPKCASTAIKKHLAQALGIHYQGNVHNAPFTWTSIPLHGYTDVVVVREPLLRLYSLWKNKIAAGCPQGPRYVKGLDLDVFRAVQYEVFPGMDFVDFARSLLAVPLEKADPHWAPQTTQFPVGALVYRMESPLLRLLLPVHNANPVATKLEYLHAYNYFPAPLWQQVTDYYEADFNMLNENHLN